MAAGELGGRVEGRERRVGSVKAPLTTRTGKIVFFTIHNARYSSFFFFFCVHHRK